MSKKTAASTKKNTDEDEKPRKVKEATYRSFNLQKPIPKPETVKLPNSFTLFGRSVGILLKNWKLFLGILAVVATLNLLLVQGLFGTNVGDAKAAAESTATGPFAKLTAGFSVVGSLFSSSGAAAASGPYRLVLLIIGSLAFIWALRQIKANNKIRIRDAFYEGMYPFIPFILVFLVVSIELGPLALGLYVYTASAASGGLELILWGVLLTLLAALTLYWLSSSLFALYITALPGRQPVASLRSAVTLVRHRRFLVLRRVLFLPLVLLVLFGVVMLPTIYFATAISSVVFFILLMVTMPMIHSYMYTVYRELLNEK